MYRIWHSKLFFINGQQWRIQGFQFRTCRGNELTPLTKTFRQWPWSPKNIDKNRKAGSPAVADPIYQHTNQKLIKIQVLIASREGSIRVKSENDLYTLWYLRVKLFKVINSIVYIYVCLNAEIWVRVSMGVNNEGPRTLNYTREVIALKFLQQSKMTFFEGPLFFR